MTFPKSITLVTLGVTDLARSRAFYAALGWEAHTAQEGVVFIQLAGQVLALFGLDDLAKDQGVPAASLGQRRPHAGPQLRHRARGRRRLRARPLRRRHRDQAPREGLLGRLLRLLRRPRRPCLGARHNPFWPLAPDGTLTLP